MRPDAGPGRDNVLLIENTCNAALLRRRRTSAFRVPDRRSRGNARRRQTLNTYRQDRDDVCPWHESLRGLRGPRDGVRHESTARNAGRKRVRRKWWTLRGLLGSGVGTVRGRRRGVRSRVPVTVHCPQAAGGAILKVYHLFRGGNQNGRTDYTRTRPFRIGCCRTTCRRSDECGAMLTVGYC